MEIQQSAALALQKRAKLSSLECNDLIGGIDSRLTAIKARCESIEVGGPERKRVLEVGTPDDIEQLNAELEGLLTENDSIYAQRSALAAAKEKALLREAPKKGRQAIRGLLKKLKAAEETAALHKANLQELENLRLELLTARNTADQARKDCPALDVAAFNRLAELLSWEGAGHLHRRQAELCGPESLKIENPWNHATRTPNRPHIRKIIPG